MISNVGLQNSQLYLTEIIFGLRCKSTTVFSVMKSLEKRDIPIEFYQIVEVPKKFTLVKEKLSLDSEHLIGLPRCIESITQSLMEDF